jgi:hypothetical protein
MAKRIRLLSANFRSASIKLGAEAMTTVHISAPFEQLVAEQMGVKDRVYKKKADEDEPDMRDYGVGIEWYGPQIVIRPKQGTLDGKARTDGPGSTFRLLKLSDVRIKRHKDDEQMLVSFNATLLDSDAQMHQLIHAVKKDGIDIDIIPPSKKAAAEASDQMRLISKEQAADTAEEND